MELSVASNRLSRLDLCFSLDSVAVRVLWFRVMQNRGEWMISRHTHSSYEFHFVAGGSCRVRLDDGEFTAREGEFYLTPPGVFHEQSGSGGEDYTEYSINVDFLPAPGETEGTELLKTFAEAGCRAVRDEFGAIRHFHEALNEVYEQRLGYCSSVRSLAAQILVCAARALGGNGRKSAVPLKVSGNDQRFAAIRSLVEDNLSARFTAADLNSHIYLSSRQICRIVRQYTGKSTQQYINSLRLQRAKELLRDTNLTLQEISDRLGFSSVYYFSQFFKREDGFAPGEFRWNVRNS